MTRSQILKCELCGNKFKKDKGSLILTKRKRGIGICPSCHDDVYKDGLRYDVDIMIVPVTEESFKISNIFNKYISPYVKRRPKLIAFYMGGEIKAITHISIVSKIIPDVHRTEIEYLYNNQKYPNWMNKKEFNIFEIQNPIMLRHKIDRKSASTIQNRVYKTFKEFTRAKEIEDLMR